MKYAVFSIARCGYFDCLAGSIVWLVLFPIINTLIFAVHFEERTDLEKLLRIMRVFLLLLFIAYLGGLTLFTHSHVVNGVIIVHSHPFKGQHEHTEVQLETIFFLSSFVASSFSALLSATPIFLILLCVLAVLATERIKSTRSCGSVRLRAPPFYL